jgi:Ca2+-binding RTX toxin-like protein
VRKRWGLVVPVVAVGAMSLPAAAVGAKCDGINATISGTSGAETLIGTSGDDVIDAKAGQDIIRSRAGDDLICPGDGFDRTHAGAGDDRASDDLNGFTGIFHGGSGDDEFLGDAGQLHGGSGADELRSTNDSFSLIYGGEGPDVLTGSFTVIDGAFAEVYGQEGDDVIRLFQGDDEVYGGEGMT